MADPFVVTTTVDLGTTGISLTQVDTYAAGRQSYSTRVRLVNTSGSAMQAIVYRAGDCYVANSDFGFGDASESSVACVSNTGRVAKWIPLTGGSSYIEASYSQVWAAIGSQQPFPNTTRATEYIDNGAGLSWSVAIPSSGDAEVAHLTAFAQDESVADRDGDGLLDEWETNGFDADGDGVPEVDLPAMGASPDHKDLFVEVDWMTRARSCFLWWCWDGQDFAPQSDSLRDLQEAYKDAPVANPDGVTGITLHVDAGPESVMNPITGTTWGARSRGNSVAWDSDLGAMSTSGYDWSEFNTLKAAHFEPARADVFHYAIYGDQYGGSRSSGIAQVSASNWEGDSFLVTDGAFNDGAGFTRRQESGTFMHEFGHVLGLKHGGGTHENYKPNHQSIMSYSWQLGGRPLDYSRTELATLNENSLDEPAGIPGATGAFKWFCPDGSQRQSSSPSDVDWNCDGTVGDTLVSVDTNRSGSLDSLAGFDDWSNIVYDGGAVGAFGLGDLHDEDPPLQFSPAQEENLDVFRNLGLLSADGDGAVAVTGPYVLLPGIADQKLRLQVTNAGAATADYDAGIAGVPGVPSAGSVTDVPGYGTAYIDLEVDADDLLPGRYVMTVTLKRPGGGAALASTTAEVLVPDLSDPTVLAEAEQIREALRTPQPGLDETIRQWALAAYTAIGANVSPVVASITPTFTDACTVSAAAAFTDPNTTDTHTATLGWGDGSSSAATISEAAGSGTATGSHSYAGTGTYTVTATVTDDKGAVGVGEQSVTTKNTAAPFGPLPKATDGWIGFRTGQTIGVKIAANDCSGDFVRELNPTIQVDQVDSLPGGPIDEGNIAELSADGKNFVEKASYYQYNLSTSASTFAGGGALTPGTYRVTVNDPSFVEPAVIGIRLR